MVKLPKELQKKHIKKDISNWRENFLNRTSIDFFLLKKDPSERTESDLRLLEERLIKVRYTNERETQVGLLIQIGETYKFLGPMDKSIDAFKNAIKIAKELGNKYQIFIALFQLGNAYVMNGFYNEALHHTQEAYKIIESEKNFTEFESMILQALGEIYSCLGDNKKANNIYNEALSLVKQNEEGELSEGLILMAIAKIKRKIGQISESLNFYKLALKLMQKLNEKFMESSILLEISANYDYLGEINRAIEYAQKSRENYIKLNIKMGIGATSYNIGGMLLQYGDKKGAMKNLIQSLKIFKELNNPLWSARTLWCLKDIYLRKGDIVNYEEARDDAITLMTKTKSTLESAKFMLEASLDLLMLYDENEDGQEKIDLLHEILEIQKRSLLIFKNADSPYLVGMAMTRIGYTYALLDKYPEALKSYEDAIAKFQNSGTIYFLAITFTKLGELYLKHDNPTKSIENYKNALQIYQNLLKKLEGTNLYRDFKEIFSILPQLIEDIRENIYESCFIDCHSDILEDIKKLAIEVCKNVEDANLKRYIPEVGKNPQLIKEILILAKNRQEQIEDLKAKIRIFKNAHEKNKGQPHYYDDITKRINIILKDKTPFINYWQKKLKNNNYDLLCEDSKSDLIAIRMIMVYLDEYLEICLFQCAKIIEREIQQKIFEIFRRQIKNVNLFNCDLNNSMLTKKIRKSINHSHMRVISFLKGKTKLTLGNFSFILEHMFLLKQKSIHLNLFETLQKSINNSYSNQVQENLLEFLVKPSKLLNIANPNYKEIRFNDLRNYVAHPKDSISQFQIKIDKIFVNQLIDILTDKPPHILVNLIKF